MSAGEPSPIRDESIRLGQFLKLADLVDTGAEAKPLIAEGRCGSTARSRPAVDAGELSEGRRGRRSGSAPSGVADGEATASTTALPMVVPQRAVRAARSADVDQVHHEDQRLAGLDDAAGAAVAVREVRRDDEPAAAADLHALRRRCPSRR